ncbi:sensor histidine kinase [Mucilaginibacter pallidiroseus]|uniref:sensor histidine kinase n=1 Tax=Mucilaginibacter pallidiroseus TaxID=2599295 RepID=UPI0021BD7F96|nr:ATP-binding protein [Mucilaginibacter pallidiroseus]
MHLHSILQNLITNAIKYRHPNRLPIISIDAEQTHNEIKISVADNGLGIPKGKQKGLFSKYMRFHEHVEGTGVGLYLVQQLLGSHGGFITVESEEGEGATFTVFLPLKEVPANNNNNH